MTASARAPRSVSVPEDRDSQQQQVTESGWWNIKQAAAYLGVSTAFIRKSVRLGRIPYARAGGKVLRFRRIELDRWLESNGSGGEAAHCKQ